MGKKILLASYGSGNTMTVVTGRMAPRSVSVVGRWNLEALLGDYAEPPFETYQAWLDTVRTPENYPGIVEASPPPPGRFALTGLRGDGYREYRLV